ncbi:MAG: FHA domain-containing protein [Myxococcota bacterium]
MGFQLVIAQGKEAGREFVFEQGSVVIGRTSECDVVLYDPGVSRRHARIYSEGPAYFVEDMGSSNGTKVNGSIVKKQQLSDGDALALGPVVFSFSAVVLEPEASTGDSDPGVAGQSTRIVSAEDVMRQRNRGVALVPQGADAQQLQKLSKTRTKALPAVAKARVSAQHAELSRQRDGGSPEGLSAAERARIRRESSPVVANWRIFWAEASAGTRRLLGTGLAVMFLGALGVVYYLVIVPPQNQTPLPPEPTSLARKPIESSFGYGEEVDYERADMKIFDFEFNAPVRAVVLLHFQSKDISQGEVLISVNGADVGAVPPDTLAANEKSHEVLIPAANLKKAEKNTVTFDNVRNPPRNDPWRIWNVWIEVNFLPDLPPEDIVREATSTFQRAQQNYERRDVGSVNRYEAWSDFRKAWLMLEAHPDPKPELYQLARDKVREAQQELDRTCAKLLLQAQTEYNLNQFDAARSTLEYVRDFFPANDQPCPWRAERQRVQFGL